MFVPVSVSRGGAMAQVYQPAQPAASQPVRPNRYTQLTYGL